MSRSESSEATDPPRATPRAGRRRSPWLRWGFRLAGVLLASCAALFVSLVLAELWIGGPRHLEGPAQLRWLFEPDAEVGYRTASNCDKTMLDGSRAVRVRFNGVGMRGPNYPAKKPDEKRVLFLGDSMTFGLGLEEDEAFPAQFARQATTAWGVVVTAGNAAAPSLGTRDFAPFVGRVRTAFAPDLIVAVVYLGNDFFDNFAHDRTVIDGYPMDGWAARLAKTSWRARLCLRYGVAWKIETWLIANLPAVAMDTSRGKKSAAEETETAGFPASPHDFAFLDDTSDPPPIARLVARMEECLAATQREAQGVPVVVLILPTHAHVVPGQYEAQLKVGGRDPARFVSGTSQARVAAICGRLGLRHIDVTTVLRQQPDAAASFLSHNLHLSARGCETIAAALVEALR